MCRKLSILSIVIIHNSLSSPWKDDPCFHWSLQVNTRDVQQDVHQHLESCGADMICSYNPILIILKMKPWLIRIVSMWPSNFLIKMKVNNWIWVPDFQLKYLAAIYSGEFLSSYSSSSKWPSKNYALDLYENNWAAEWKTVRQSGRKAWALNTTLKYQEYIRFNQFPPAETCELL